MSSLSRGCDASDRWDMWIRSTLKDSVAGCAPSGQVRGNLLQAAAARQISPSTAILAEQPVHADCPTPWSLWALYGAYIDLHRSVMR